MIELFFSFITLAWRSCAIRNSFIPMVYFMLIQETLTIMVLDWTTHIYGYWQHSLHVISRFKNWKLKSSSFPNDVFYTIWTSEKTQVTKLLSLLSFEEYNFVVWAFQFKNHCIKFLGPVINKLYQTSKQTKVCLCWNVLLVQNVAL